MEKRQQYEQMVNGQIEQQLTSLFPHSAGQANHTRVERALREVAQQSFEAGRQYALMSLLTIDDLAALFQVSMRRVRAIAKARHERFGIGYQVPGTRGQWLFTPEEVEQLRPDEKHRRRSE